MFFDKINKANKFALQNDIILIDTLIFLCKRGVKMIIFFEPVFFDKVWGGNFLSSKFNFNVSNTCGECWGISTHKNGESIIKNTEFKGKTLKYLFDNHKSYFGNYSKNEFPILVKIIDAQKDLSIQVHPDDSYARKLGSFGKSECWYILDALDNTKMIIGHNAKSLDELTNMINSKDYNNLLNKIDVKKNDYFYIEAGTVHAICKGTLLLEVQQSSDITYRLYDYDRLDNGKLRDLHIKKAIEVIKIPDNEVVTTHNNKYFDYEIIEIHNNTSFISHLHGDYLAILEGHGTINDLTIKKGDFLMVTSNESYNIDGNIKLQRTRF